MAAMPLAAAPALLATPAPLAAAAAVFALAGLVKGVVGLGLPTLSMALLALVMPPAQAAALLIVPSLATNVWQMRPAGTLAPLLRRLWPLQAGVCAGTWGAAGLIGADAGPGAVRALGLALLAYAAWGLLGRAPRLSARAQRWAGPLAGALTGGIVAATGVFVVPAVPYLQALGLPRAALVQAMGLSFTVSTLALGGALAAHGQWPVGAAAASAAMLPPALLGMAAGQRLARRLAPAAFRTGLLGALAALGGWMLLGGR
jgi:uncharacterized membrane protein YfcA